MMEKEARTSYITSVNKFITNLIQISLLLKSHPEEERKERLKYFIGKANKILFLSRSKIKEGIEITQFYQGIVLPFGNYEKKSNYSSSLVKIT
jgi:hypothetical protein